MRPQLVIATANPGKVAEITEMLGDVAELVPRPADVGEIVEDAGTLAGNARLKAATVAGAAGAPAVADDTGLEIDALDGAPGVDTAYFAGPRATDADNRAKAIAELAGASTRRATFRTVATVVWPDGHEVVAEGTCVGTILDAERGTCGFGFDALFVPDDGDGRTFAEMTAAEKDALSHRGRAFGALVTALASDDRFAGADRR